MELQVLTAVVLLPFLLSFAESLEPIKIAHTVEASKAKKNPANIEYVVDDKSSPEKGKCTDTFLRCSKWKDMNVCRDERYKSYMKFGCAKTCRYCGCRDTYEEAPYCAEWKTRGFCKKHKGQMETYCAKTCGFCGEDQRPKPPKKSLSPTSSVSTPTATSAKTQTNVSASASLEPTTGFSRKPSDAPTETLSSETSGQTPTTAAHSTVNPDLSSDSLAIARESVVTGETSSVRNAEKSTEKDFSIMAAVRGSRRGLTFKTETMPGVWSLGDDNDEKLPDQIASYGSETEGALNPMEVGKYMTPTKSDDKYEYYTGHYSNDPFVAESQREDWTDRNKKITGDNYRKSVSKKPQDKLIKDEESVAASTVKKATLAKLTKKQGFKKIKIHSL